MPIPFPLILPRPRRHLSEWLLFAAGLLLSGAILATMIVTERASALEADAARMRAQALVIDHALPLTLGWAAFWLTCLAALSLAQGRRSTLHALQRSAEQDRIAAAERVALALNGANLGLWRCDPATGRLQVDARGCAMHVGMTKLPTRRLLMDRLGHTLAKAERAGVYGAVLFVDLDNFKTLNDTLGHDMGDRLLEMVAFRLLLVTREADTLARLGGDEFVVLLEDLGGAPDAAAHAAEIVAQKVLDTLSLPYQLDGNALRSTPSIGVALFGDAHHTTDDLLRQAEIAMHEAKAAGRATFRFFDPA